MPSLYLHNKFSKDVYNILDKKSKSNIDNNEYLYEVFSQSFDNLFYYNFLSIMPGKKIRDLAHYGQRHRINDYFINILHTIKTSNCDSKSAMYAYLYGSLNHYVMDHTFHPYIIYKTGNYEKKNRKTKIYQGLHNRFERDLDAYVYEKYNHKNFKTYKIYLDLFKKVKFPNELINSLDYVFKHTFNVDNMGKIYEKSYNQGNLVYRLLVYDRLGIKQVLYKLVDLITFKKQNKYQYFSFYTKPLDVKDINLEHKLWCNPYSKNITSNKSLEDLYKKALKESTYLISVCNRYLENLITEYELRDILGDLSYSSSLPWKENRKPRYFDSNIH